MQSLRLDKLRKILQEKNLDGFLVSNFYNIFYLSGFKTLVDDEREAWVFVTNKRIYLFSDSRYVSGIASLPSVARNDMSLKLITPEKGLIKHLREVVTEERIRNLGVEGEDLKVSEFNQFIKYLSDVNLVSLEKIIIKIREIKDEEEINKIREACRITDRCLENIIKTIKVGQTEKEIAFKIEFWLKEKNYDLAFYPIVAIDKNSSLPHHDTRDGNNRKVKKGSIILIDFGAKYQDYLSDITRMIFIGEPDNEVVNIYNKLLDAQTKTIESAFAKASADKQCLTGKDVDSFCRKGLSYPHSTGHGVGLQIHEYPKISSVSADEIKAGQVFTIEPGVYMTGKWGMRIEDTILIKENGVEVLTKFRKQLLII